MKCELRTAMSAGVFEDPNADPRPRHDFSVPASSFTRQVKWPAA
jgi:hypothetical protein